MHAPPIALVVDDEVNILSFLAENLASDDFVVHAAPTVAHARSRLSAHRPDIVLLDVGLPDGSGLALLDRLKRTPATRHIPVHMMSVDDHSQTALALGAVGATPAAAAGNRLKDLVDIEGFRGNTLTGFGIVVGLIIGLILDPSVPSWMQPYLPIAVIAALDAVFGALRAVLDGIFDDKVFVISFLSNVVVAALIVFIGDQLGVGSQLSTGVVVVLGVRIFSNVASIRRHLFHA